MTMEELKVKSPEQLKENVLSLKKELFNLRFQVATGELSNTSRFREVRRTIARILTVLNQTKKQ
jgi:large subunit ribosomal protein L29